MASLSYSERLECEIERLTASNGELLEALEDCAEALAFARDKLSLSGEGDGKDRRADATDPTGSLHVLTCARAAIEKARS